MKYNRGFVWHFRLEGLSDEEWEVVRLPQDSTAAASDYFYDLQPIFVFLSEVEAIGGTSESRFPLTESKWVLYEMIFTRLVDDYTGYLGHILSNIFRVRSDALNSSEKIQYDEILQFKTMEALLEYIAERKIRSLTYKSLADLVIYFKKHFNLSVLESGSDLDMLNDLAHKRNLIVHNFGRVNLLYKDQVPNTSLTLGERIDINYKDLLVVGCFLSHLVRHLDKQVMSKFPQVGDLIGG